MANIITKLWHYLNSWGNSKFDEKADPKIQIQQAIDKAQKQHEAIAQQAAAVIGQQHQLELKLNRQLTEISELEQNTKQALVLSDQAKKDGDSVAATRYEEAAQSFAQQLTTAESSVQDLKTLIEQSRQAATQARSAVERSANQLQETLNERSKLLTQLEQAKLQEQVSQSLNQVNGLVNNKSVPNFDEVRNKIEGRYSQALAQAELAKNTTQGKLAEVKISSAQLEGRRKLDSIRSELQLGEGSTPQQQLENGTGQE